MLKLKFSIVANTKIIIIEKLEYFVSVFNNVRGVFLYFFLYVDVAVMGMRCFNSGNVLLTQWCGRERESSVCTAIVFADSCLQSISIPFNTF